MQELKDRRVLGLLLGHCGHLGRERMEARLSEQGIDITPVQTHVLLYLDRHGGEATQSEVVAHLRVKPSTANGIIDRMEEKHLVRRSVSTRDARQKRVVLTEKGREKQTQIRTVFAETEDVIAQGFSPEDRETLFDLLQRVRTNLEEDRRA